MKTRKIHEIIKSHPFFSGCDQDEINLISGCGQNKVFQKGEQLAKEQDPADIFYLIKKGHVAICTQIPNRDKQVIQTIGDNEIFGWSWLFPPYRWMFEAIALEVTHCIAMDGKCLRNKLEENPALGYKLMKEFSLLIIKRLNATRLQLLDVYGNKSA